MVVQNAEKINRVKVPENYFLNKMAISDHNIYCHRHK
jgi:hypothetical protein